MDCLKHFKIAMPSLWKCFNVNKICKDSTTKQDQQFHAMNNNIYVHTLNDLGSVTKHIQYTCTMPNSNYYTMPSATTLQTKKRPKVITIQCLSDQLLLRYTQDKNRLELQQGNETLT